MIDIHSHILPGVDDGARDMAHALQIARLAIEDGTTHIFATPHNVLRKPVTYQQVIEQVTSLQTELDNHNIPLIVLPGHEIHLYHRTLWEWDNGRVGPLNHSRYVLTEPDFFLYTQETNNILFGLFERGCIPILAHPERIGPIQQDISIIEPILERGGLVQITANSLLGTINSPARRTAEELLKQGLVHIIASDAHNTTYRRPGLSQARDAAAQIVGEQQAITMVTSNPAAVMNDKPLH